MKAIRLWGVIAFFVLGIILTLSWYLVAPMMIAKGIESFGSEALGAKVEVEEVDLALFPLRIEINNLQAADPDQPMVNLFEANKINFAVDSEALLWKKVLIDELIIEGVQLATPRTSSGALEGGRESEKLASEISTVDIPEMTKEGVLEMVDKADLITAKRIEKLNDTQQEMNQFWKTALDEAASKERMAVLEKEFSRLSKRAKSNQMNLITDRKAWKKLKKNIDTERKQISDLNRKLKLDRKEIQKQIADVRKGPKDDLDAIMGSMGLNNGVAGLSDKFLGPQFTPWIEKFIAMTDGMNASTSSTDETTVYETSKGYMVQFKDEQIFPDLLIKKLSLSGRDTDWAMSGLGTDIAYFPWLTGQPANLDLDFKGDGKAKLLLNSNWSSADEMLTKIDSTISNWQINNMKLMETEQGGWMINSGKLDSSLVGSLTLQKVDIKLSIKLNSPNISSPENLSGWQKTLAKSLNKQKQLTIDVTAKGSLQEPDLKVKSNIEKLFAEAIGEKLKQQAEKLTGDFSSAISEKVGDLSFLDSFGGDFDKWTEQLQGNDDLLKKLKFGI